MGQTHACRPPCAEDECNPHHFCQEDYSDGTHPPPLWAVHDPPEWSQQKPSMATLEQIERWRAPAHAVLNPHMEDIHTVRAAPAAPLHDEWQSAGTRHWNPEISRQGEYSFGRGMAPGASFQNERQIVDAQPWNSPSNPQMKSNHGGYSAPINNFQDETQGTNLDHWNYSHGNADMATVSYPDREFAEQQGTQAMGPPSIQRHAPQMNDMPSLNFTGLRPATAAAVAAASPAVAEVEVRRRVEEMRRQELEEAAEVRRKREQAEGKKADVARRKREQAEREKDEELRRKKEQAKAQPGAKARAKASAPAEATGSSATKAAAEANPPGHQHVLSPSGARVQVLLDDGWRDCSEEELHQMRMNLDSGTSRFAISSRGAMYVVDFSDPANPTQMNPSTKRTRRLQVIM